MARGMGLGDPFELFEWLDDARPDLRRRYEELYRRGAYLPSEERRRLGRLVRGPDLPLQVRMRGADPPMSTERPDAPADVQPRLF